jgi:hypothetical protein
MAHWEGEGGAGGGRSGDPCISHMGALSFERCNLPRA